MVVKVKQSQQHTDNWTDECRLWLVSVWAGLDCDIAGFGWSVCGPGLIVTLQTTKKLFGPVISTLTTTCDKWCKAGSHKHGTEYTVTQLFVLLYEVRHNEEPLKVPTLPYHQA